VGVPISIIHPKGTSPYKKAEIVLQFLGILESFWRILDISKRMLEPVFLEIADRIFSAHFGNYVAKHRPS